MKVSIKDNVLVIEIPMKKPAPSGSGKTLIVATTSGGKTVDVQVEGKPLTINLNAYISAKQMVTRHYFTIGLDVQFETDQEPMNAADAFYVGHLIRNALDQHPDLCVLAARIASEAIAAKEDWQFGDVRDVFVCAPDNDVEYDHSTPED